MVKIEAIIQPFKLEDVKTSLEALGIFADGTYGAGRNGVGATSYL